MLLPISVAVSILGLANIANGSPKPCTVPAGKALYFLGNEPDQNTVIAVTVGKNGLLSGGTITPTSGFGSNSVDAEGQAATPDPLVSQASLVVVENLIFAVNAGSNTISLLSIDPSDPTQLTLVGEPAQVPGEFPNTIAASAKHRIVCVGTTGSKAGVSCGAFDEQSGIGTMDDLRSFELGQSTPPVGPTNTVSQVFFSEDESRLYTTVKGDPTVNNTGFLSVFPMEEQAAGSACLSRKEVRSSPNGTAVLFGSKVIPGTDNIFTTDASFGGAVLSVDDDTLKASTVGRGVIDGQMATCWAAIAPETNSAFVTDVLSKRLVEQSLDDASIKGEFDLSGQSAGGFIDLATLGGLVFMLATDVVPSILVVDVRRGISQAVLVQEFDIAALGAGANSQGLALLV
jgi:hypothetical protein